MKTLVSKFLAAIFLLLASLGTSHAQKITVTGTVYDSVVKLPICEIIIQQQGAKNIIRSDMSGKYEVRVPKGSTLEFRHKHYVTQTIVATTDTIDVNMVMKSTSTLDDMVITA